MLPYFKLAEVVAGKVLSGDVHPRAVNSSDFPVPFNKFIAALQKRGKLSESAAIGILGLSNFQAIQNAAESVRMEADWPKLLKVSALKYRAGKTLESAAKDLLDGKEVLSSTLLGIIAEIDEEAGEWVTADKVKPETVRHKPVGWPAIDQHIGIPAYGLTVLGAPPGVGKTSFMVKAATCLVHNNPKAKVAIFTMEMTNAQIVNRMMEIQKVPLSEKRRIMLNEKIMGATQVAALTTRAVMDGATFICLDFADLMVEDMISEPEVAKIYRILSIVSKELRVPFLVISQLSRTWAYEGRAPIITDLRYSGAIEQFASKVIFVHNPTTIWAGDRQSANQFFPPIKGRGYLIDAKDRFGFVHDSPGYIALPWLGKSAWGNRAIGGWKSLSLSKSVEASRDESAPRRSNRKR